MRRFDFEDEDWIETLYVGTAREMRSLYKNLAAKTSAIPLFVEEPVFTKSRMYGIYVQTDGFYSVVTADICLDAIIRSMKYMMCRDVLNVPKNYIEIPEGATNGDMIKTMFPNIECREDRLGNMFVISDAQLGYIVFRESWWNAPYKE